MVRIAVDEEDNQDFRILAACQGEDTELFFPDDDRSPEVAIAKSICEGCEVILECRAWAMKHETGPDMGIWGGLTSTERRKLRRNQTKALRRARYTPEERERINRQQRESRERKKLRAL